VLRQPWTAEPRPQPLRRGSGAAWRTRPAVLLNARGTQTGKAVRLERTLLPGEELLLRELVAAQSLLHCDPAAAHGSHHRGFAADNPPRGIGGCQIVHWRCSQRRLLDDAIQPVSRGSWTRPKDRSLSPTGREARAFVGRAWFRRNDARRPGGKSRFINRTCNLQVAHIPFRRSSKGADSDEVAR
jgi:hypothetical protein